MTYYKNPELIMGSFPASLTDEARKLAAKFSSIEVWGTPFYRFNLGKETIDVPYRVVFKDPLNDSNDILHLCLRSRSTNGYEREAAVKRLLAKKVPEWAAPYILVALVDYVVEVSTLPADAGRRVTDDLRTTLKNNPGLSEFLKQRAISYWNEYYRETWSDYRLYPPYATIEFLSRAKGSGL